MNKTYEIKKYAADKIALLSLFVVALLTARFITASKSAIVLSDPIELSYAGLSVPMPAGNGWQSEKQWEYQQDSFTLSSVFAPRSGNVTALAHCRYLLAPTMTAPDAIFKQKASAVAGAITKTGQTQTDTLTIDWAHIKKQKTLFDMFFGTARLPNNRRLDIEVHQTTGDTNLAEQVFKRITEELKFKDNQLLEAGSEIITKIKNAGLDTFLDNQNQQAFFIIKDTAKRTIGFTMDVLIDSGQNAQLNIQAAGLYYIRGRYASEQVTFFQGNNNLDEFTWKSEISKPAGRSSTEITLDKAGVMIVRKLGRDPKRDRVRLGTRPRTREKKCQLNHVAIPDLFLEFTFSQMLDSDHKKIVVDTIEAEGTIIPRFISRIEAEDRFASVEASAAEEEAAYVLRVEFLGGRGFSEQVYLDSQKQISKILLQHKSVYTLERTSLENILRQFPEQADHILQKNKILEQSQPKKY